MTEQELAVAITTPTHEGVQRAMAKIAAILPKTPLLPLEVDGAAIWCKAEMLQPIGAFKIRGAWHRLSDLNEDERARGVVGVSSGNHAQGVAWAAKKLGISATIVMPSNAPRMKLEATKALGAQVVLYDRATESREEVAAALIAQNDATLVHAFGDPWVIEGQGTAGIEIAEQLQGWDDIIRSLEAGEILPVNDLLHPTYCDALQTPQTYPVNFDVLRSRVSQGVSVTTAEVAAAMRLVFEKLHLVVEPGGAVALAAVLAGKIDLKPVTAVTLSGGNVDRETFVQLLAQAA